MRLAPRPKFKNVLDVFPFTSLSCRPSTTIIEKTAMSWTRSRKEACYHGSRETNQGRFEQHHVDTNGIKAAENKLGLEGMPRWHAADNKEASAISSSFVRMLRADFRDGEV